MRVMYRRWAVFFMGLLPLAWLGWCILNNQLGPEPAKTLVHFTGQWAVHALLLTLAVTPLKRGLHWRWLQAHRRMLGLWALAYALLHALAYAVFLLGGNWQSLATELQQRPYITVSLPALMILILLGLSSPRWAMRALGRHWQRLHYGIYPASVLIWLHVLWQVRASYQLALVYGLLLGGLLAVRLMGWWQKRRPVSLASVRT